jgi:hypothetical protein
MIVPWDCHSPSLVEINLRTWLVRLQGGIPLKKPPRRLGDCFGKDVFAETRKKPLRL